jgi:hypothetical protein
MLKLLVQEYLENHTFGDLAREHGVYASFSKSGHKFSLNYDQIEAKESNPLAQECRGLVLACKDGTELLSKALTLPGHKTSYDLLSPGTTTILAFPMRRFFNHGQGSAAEIDWSDPKLAVLEKLDGTLCIVYYDPFTDKWCVATRSVPEADLTMDNGMFTFRTLFEKALTETTGYEFDVFTRFLDKAYTYCFELTTPYNRIVVEYKKNGITLLAVRGLVTLQELDFKHPVVDLLPTSLPLVQGHTYTTVDELVTWVSSLNPMEHEGVVVRDSKFNRIKVKNAAYVAYNKVRDALATSPRNIVELILSEKDDDVVSFLPEEIVKNLQMIKSGIQLAIREHDEAYQIAKAEADKIVPGDKKTFAILVTKDKGLWTAPFFQMFDGKASNMKDFIAKNRKDGTWGNSFLDKMLELSKHQY